MTRAHTVEWRGSARGGLGQPSPQESSRTLRRSPPVKYELTCARNWRHAPVTRSGDKGKQRDYALTDAIFRGFCALLKDAREKETASRGARAQRWRESGARSARRLTSWSKRRTYGWPPALTDGRTASGHSLIGQQRLKAGTARLGPSSAPCQRQPGFSRRNGPLAHLGGCGASWARFATDAV
ncbi:hypothetical protein HPB51_012316 [Rhipicephalus microplus]|uniref:Uncharacterized protein n=1 Tax=Rhipicephalus microplus TaxID=6941 RepID=A0A9J6D9K7_RHIMP|nr:hypothetical protein HPB51_012316 [Rhipicephalus microplus]